MTIRRGDTWEMKRSVRQGWKNTRKKRWQENRPHPYMSLNPEWPDHLPYLNQADARLPQDITTTIDKNLQIETQKALLGFKRRGGCDGSGNRANFGDGVFAQF